MSMVHFTRNTAILNSKINNQHRVTINTIINLLYCDSKFNKFKIAINKKKKNTRTNNTKTNKTRTIRRRAISVVVGAGPVYAARLRRAVRTHRFDADAAAPVTTMILQRCCVAPVKRSAPAENCGVRTGTYCRWPNAGRTTLQVSATCLMSVAGRGRHYIAAAVFTRRTEHALARRRQRENG